MTNPLTQGGRARLLAVVDHVIPAAVGLVFVVVHWVLNISRCRGWPPDGDHENHLFTAITIHHDYSVETVLNSGYPPLTYLWANLMFLLMGPQRAAGELAISLFVIPLALGTYHLVRILAGRPAALLALGLVCLNRETLWLGQTFLLDLPLAATVALTMWALVSSQMCSTRRSGVLLGLCIGAGMLTKFNYFYFASPLILVMLYMLYRGLRWWFAALMVLVLAAPILVIGSQPFLDPYLWTLGARQIHAGLLIGFLVLAYVAMGLLPRTRLGRAVLRDRDWYHRARNMLLAAVVAVIPAAPWYSHNLTHLWTYWTDMGLKAHKDSLGPWRFFEQVGLLWAGAPLFLLAGLVAIPWLVKQRRERVALVLGSVATFLLIALSMEPQGRFFLPLLPLFALLGTWWLSLLGRWAWGATAAIVAVQIVVHVVWAGQLSSLSNLRLPWVISEQLKAEARGCKLQARVATLEQEIARHGPGPRAILYRTREDRRRMLKTAYLYGFHERIMTHVLAQSGDYPRPYVLLKYHSSFEAEHAADMVQGTLVAHPTTTAQPADLPRIFGEEINGRLKLLRRHPLLEGREVRLYRLEAAGRRRWLLPPGYTRPPTHRGPAPGTPGSPIDVKPGPED